MRRAVLCARSRARAPALENPARARRLSSINDSLAIRKDGANDVGEADTPKQDPAAVSAFTGAPEEYLAKRVVKIFTPPPGVQNATQNTLKWKMAWEDKQTKRWVNPLMGWTSTSDPLSNTHMTLEFDSRDDAVRFAERNGWTVETSDPAENLALVHKGPKKYADNFRWQGPKGRAFPSLYEASPPPPKA
jgi:NADH dehydrogenase (ubiquinone) Fe-S protein 4